MNIGVFDSGIGGLSVALAIARRSANAQIHYACDQKNLPYGTKNESQLASCVFSALDRWPQRPSCEALVIACNTVSTALLDELRYRYSVPIFGVVPPIKPAAERSKTQVIALLATPATIHRPYIDRLIEEFANDQQVIRVGSSTLVSLAEQKLQGQKLATETIAEECRPIINRPDCDQLALGCTHFSFLSDELRQVLGPKISIIDPADAVARHLCQKLNISTSPTESPKLESFASTGELSAWRAILSTRFSIDPTRCVEF